MNAIRGIVEAAIYSSDLGAAERFYCDVLGFTLLGKETGRHVFFQVGQQQVLLVFLPGEHAQRRSPARPRSSAAPGHVALGVAPEDLDLWRQRLARHGVEIEHEQILGTRRQVALFPRSRRKLDRARDPGNMGPTFRLVGRA